MDEKIDAAEKVSHSTLGSDESKISAVITVLIGIVDCGPLLQDL